MAGGNSHQRAVNRAAQVPVHKQVTDDNFPGVAKRMPWYESGLFWGCISLAAAIVLTVIAAMLKDLRWLLVFVWPLLAIAGVVVIQKLTSWIPRALVVLLLLMSGVGLWVLKSSLTPEPLKASGLDVAATLGDAYSVRVETIVQNSFWTFNGQTVCAAPVALYVALVNNKPIPAMISQFDFQVLEDAGVWRQLGHIHPVNRIYFGPELSHVGQVKYDDFLDRKLENKNLMPGETVGGWVLLNVLGATTGNIQPAFKAVVQDFGSGKFVTPEPLRPTLDSAQPRAVTMAGTMQDLSKFTLSLNCGD